MATTSDSKTWAPRLFVAAPPCQLLPAAAPESPWIHLHRNSPLLPHSPGPSPRTIRTIDALPICRYTAPSALFILAQTFGFAFLSLICDTMASLPRPPVEASTHAPPPPPNGMPSALCLGKPKPSLFPHHLIIARQPVVNFAGCPPRLCFVPLPHSPDYPSPPPGVVMPAPASRLCPVFRLVGTKTPAMGATSPSGPAETRSYVCPTVAAPGPVYDPPRVVLGAARPCPLHLSDHNRPPSLTDS